MKWQKSLWNAVEQCDLEAAKEILSKSKPRKYLRVHKDQIYYDEEAPLHLAAYCGYDHMIRLMISQGMDVNSYNVYSDHSGYKITPLHWAIYKNRVETVKLLLEVGSDPNLYGIWGKVKGVAIDFARKKKFQEIVRILESVSTTSSVQSTSTGFSCEAPEDEVKKLQLKRSDLLQDLREVELRLQEVAQDAKCTDDDDLPDVPQCPVCFGIPRFKIFNCVKCDNLICHGCLSQIDCCPFCRFDFKSITESYLRPKRNLWAEKFIKCHVSSTVSNTI